MPDDPPTRSEECMPASQELVSAGVVVRPRLVDRLERLRDPDTQESVVLLAAPPGFGKTTLVRSWDPERHRDGRPVAITHLRGVGDSRRELWRRVLDAIAEVVDGLVAEAVRRLPVPDRIGHEDFVTELLDVLGGVELVLVLDDVHEATGRHVLDDLDALVSRAPDSLRLVLLSRTRPPLPSLVDRRIRGEVDVVGAADLAFTADECAACSPGLSDADQEHVWERTEGWPAMARLMGGALARGGALDGPGWTAEDGLADRLFGESLRALDTVTQHVLLHCAVADPTPLDLLVSLTGRDDAGEVVAAVGGWSGLLREVADADTPAYRLHPILRAHLHAELLHRDAPAARSADRTCAAWFASRGDGLRAVEHAAASQSLGVLERTLAAVGLGLVADGQAGPLVRVLGRRLLRGQTGPWTAAVGAVALADLGRVSEAATLHELHPPADDPELAAAQAAVGALLRRRRGRPLAEATEVGEGVTLDTQMTLALQRGAELLRAGRADEAAPLLARAVEVAEGRAHVAALVEALALQAACDSVSGAFPVMRQRLVRARRAAEVGGWTGSPRAALMKMLEGWLAYLELDDVRARTLSARALELLDPEDDPSTVAAVRNLALGVAEGAAALDTQWMHESWRPDSGVLLAPDLVAGVALADAQLCLHTGRTDRLRETVQALVERCGDVAETHLAAAYLAAARDRPAQAAETLAPVLRDELPRTWGLTLLDARVLAARLALAQDRHYQALSEVRLALDLAVELDTPRSLLTVGPAGLGLLAEARGSWGSAEGLVERVLSHVATLRAPATVQLTDREVDVLRELPTLRTVEEIAGTMVISVNTLKTHLRSIYRKLGVSSRREAVSEARRAGLL
ncbi:LuxR C-terminal-related transcriptional regulator [Nocardioides aestuarii]|uniref:LuxR C-terminal-related transcriptional regulator n=1 Tax=Nocardioides aestuarii TaxID=252231 RepID=A0ABW4TQX6_9ACTN